MNPRARHLLLTLLAGLLVALYIGLLHHFTAQGRPSVTGAILALMPMGLTSLWLAWISPYRGTALTAWCAVAGLLALNHALLAEQFKYIELVQHAGTFACLTAVFGRTLAADRTPMVSVFARSTHGSLPPLLASYTRKVTIAWTLMFALMTAVSLILFFSGQLAHWSLLANVLTPFIIATCFLAEYLVRRLVLPTQMRTGLVSSIRAAWPGFDRWYAAHGHHERKTGTRKPPVGTVD